LALPLRLRRVTIPVMSSTDGVKTLLIVYHTQSGASAALARSVLRGASREPDVVVNVERTWDASVQSLARCDGLVLVAAENSATLSGGMKDFLDRTFYPAIERGLVLPCVLVVSAGNDGRGAEAQLKRILSGYPFPVVAEPLVLRGPVSPAHEVASEELGQAFAAGLSMGIY